jgi:hypothetical protein
VVTTQRRLVCAAQAPTAMMPIAQATLIGLPDLLRDQVRGPGEERKERDRDRGLSYSQR